VARLDASDFHELITHCRVLNAEILKTMATRVGRLQQLAMEAPRPAATVIGHRLDFVCHNMRDFLARNRVAFTWIDLDDPYVTREDAVAWSEYTRTTFRLHLREGAHFLVVDDKAFILDAISHELASLTGGG